LTFESRSDKNNLVKTYTICLVGLESREAIVIGGGKVAARKVESLLAADAQVKVISPVLVQELQQLVDAGRITSLKRAYQDGDLAGAYLVIAATDNEETNHAVWNEANRCDCLINVVDDPDHSTFILPAIVQRGEMSIAISTGGSSPALARRLRERLQNDIGPEYGLLTELLAELRPDLLASFPAGKARLQAALRVVDSDILQVIQIQGKDAALAYARAQLQQQS
jgi:precorrin-2 dehydrogenase/sirohydrochlorin ferrochelatase